MPKVVGILLLFLVGFALLFTTKVVNFLEVEADALGEYGNLLAFLHSLFLL
jgi:hypothetical protein